MAKATETDGALKRLGGGRWQTRDERFTIEPQSGTWVVVDAEQTDDLGLVLVRGPFASLTAAREAIATARDSAPAVSPLAAHLAKLRDRPVTAPSVVARGGVGPTPVAKPSAVPQPEAIAPPASARPEPAPEPQWMRDLAPDGHRRARELAGRLREAGAPDPEGMARRDVVGKVPAAPAFAIGRALAALGPDASPADVARLLADGRAPDLDVRWRLVDGDNRPITLDLAGPARRPVGRG